MGIWTPQNLGDTLSGIVTADDAQDEAIRSHERGSVSPTLGTRPNGCLWWCTDSTTLTGLGLAAEALLRWDGSNWIPISMVSLAINRAGTVTFAANQPMGGYKLTGLAAGTASGDSVRFEQVLLLSGANAMAGNLNANSNRVINLAAPSSANDAARKAYVDDAIAAVAMAGGETTATGGSPMTGEFEVGFIPKQLCLSIYQDSGVSGRKFPMMGVTFGDTATGTPVTINVFNTDSSDAGTIYVGTLTITRKASVSIGTNGPGFEWTYTPGRLSGALGTVADHVVAYIARQ